MHRIKLIFSANLLKMLVFLLSLVIILTSPKVFASMSNPTNIISYDEMGTGKPLILIHPFPTDKRLWSAQLNGLKNNFHVIAMDLRGFGKSSPADGKAITMTDYADDIKKLMDKLHIQKAIIGGESMGGYIALAFLEKYPDKVSGLVLSDTQAIADTEEAKIKRENTARDVLEHGTGSLISGFMPKALTSEAPTETKQFLQAILESQSPNAVASALRGMAIRNDMTNLLVNTRLPILIITGDQDTLIPPQQSENMHLLAKNSKLVTINNAAHLSSLEQPAQWNQAVINRFYKK